METRKFHTDTPNITCDCLDSMQPHYKLILYRFTLKMHIINVGT